MPPRPLAPVAEWHWTENAAQKRIQAARTARRFPALFSALADGRLNLTAIVLLGPRLTEETVDELVAASTHKSIREVRELLATRFPRPDVATRLEALGATTTCSAEQAARPLDGLSMELVSKPVGDHTTPGQVGVTAPPARVTPLSAERFALQLTIDRETHDMLRYAQELLGHALPAGDVPQVFKRALRTLIDELEQRKFAASARMSRSPRRGSAALTKHVERPKPARAFPTPRSRSV